MGLLRFLCRRFIVTCREVELDAYIGALAMEWNHLLVSPALPSQSPLLILTPYRPYQTRRYSSLYNHAPESMSLVAVLSKLRRQH